jgi:hypothetical protein
MNAKLLNEISSPLLRNVVAQTFNTIERIKAGEITYKQGTAEISGYKVITAGIALDWTYHKNPTIPAIPNKRDGYLAA